MSRKSGNRFSDEDMRKRKESRAHPDSTESGCALAVSAATGSQAATRDAATGHIVVIIPTLNEEQSIADVVRRIQRPLIK
jgi:hypothetical protein